MVDKTLRNIIKNTQGGLYLIAITFIVIIVGGIAYTFSYYLYNQFYTAIQPQLNLTVTGTNSVAFAVNLWDSIPFIIMIVVGFFLYTEFQRRRADEY